jgi:hypothetical protein
VRSDARYALFYIDEYLNDIKESETVEQTKVFFERHKIKSTISVIPDGLGKVVNMACGKLWEVGEVYRMDAIYLSNILDPRYKRNIIESNLLRRDARNILQMCLNKVVMMKRYSVKVLICIQEIKKHRSL